MTILSPLIPSEDLAALRSALREHAAGQQEESASAQLRRRIVRAAQERAAHAERAFEIESAEYVARHLSTAIRACDHEKRRLRALHADVLETRAAARELAREVTL
ncbi:hypothetical protein [Gordonia caeni]|uniref:Uncharacterized protein n=1 Tax=Gordonia caeni TaxID=1007097 RepID=A0ABP7PBA0_9ACTN